MANDLLKYMNSLGVLKPQPEAEPVFDANKYGGFLYKDAMSGVLPDQPQENPDLPPVPLLPTPPPAAPEAPVPTAPLQRRPASFKPSAPAEGVVSGQEEATPSVEPKSEEFKGLDFSGTENQNPRQALLDTFKTQADMNLISNMGRSADKIASGIARTKDEENPVYGAIDKQAAGLPAQHKMLQDEAKFDPNSSISKGFRSFVENRLGTPMKGNPSAADLEKVIPMLFKDYEARLAEKSKLEGKKIELGQKKEQFDAKLDETKNWHSLLASMHADRVANAKDASEVRNENKTNNDFMKMAEKLSAARSSSRGAFGKAALNMAAAENIERLVGGRNLNSLDSREIQEVARSLDRLLSQGQPTVSGTHELVPRTMVGKGASIAEYLTNQRAGANAGSFLKQMMKTVAREKDLAKEQRNRYIQEMVPGYSHLENKDPERFKTLLQGMVNQAGDSSSTKQESSPEDKKQSSRSPSSTNPKYHGPTVNQNGHVYTWDESIQDYK